MKRPFLPLLMVLLAVSPFHFSSCQEDAPKTDGKSSTAIIQILPTTPVLADPNLRTENFIANEIASLSMGKVFERAVRESNWDLEEADLDQLKTAFKVIRIEGTDMARITATSTGKVSGKEIVKALIEAYVGVREALEVDMGRRKLKALDDELIAQSDLVQDNRKELMVLIQQYGIPYFENQQNLLGRQELEALAHAKNKDQQIQEEIALLKAKLNSTKEESPEFELLSKRMNELVQQEAEIGQWVDDKKVSAIDLSLKQRQYHQAIEAFEASHELLTKMKNQQQEARVALHMPRTVVIVRQNPQ